MSFLFMKISIFSYVYKPENFLINDLAESLAYSNQVEVLTGLPNYSKEGFYPGYNLLGPYNETINRIRIVRYPLLARKSGLLRLVFNYFTSIVGSLLSIFRLKKSEVTFVFATSPIFTAIPAIIFAKLRGGKVVIWLQDLWPESFFAITNRSPNSFLGRVLGSIVKWIYKNTDLMLIQSNDFRINLEKYGYKGRIEWVPNWAKEDKAEDCPKWIDEIPNDKFVITFAGNIGVAQKLETLADAVLELNDERIHLAVVGDGREKERLENLYSDSNLIKFYGRKPAGDMPYLFEKADALAVILKKDPAFSLVVPSKVQSYLMAKKPIIASLDGAGANLINELQVGVISPSEDVDELAKNIKRLISISSEERFEMGERAFNAYAKYFKQEKVIKRIEELLQEVVNS
ncbi:glycosyltransferase family 4 protein [Halobacteriovorax sp. YZS-1-1]|uniref:glycosyltransferase family 4 protein n=1 Tax=unclassified Halobacteriovorax TaxID=2639665 RepID=UPI00399A1B03